MANHVNTIGVDLWGGQVRGTDNLATRYTRVQDAVRHALPVETLFVGAYARFAAACRKVDEPGVALIAIDAYSGRPEGIATLRARIDRHVAAIVGRHDHCDLFLARPDLALRHFAVIVDPVRSFARGAPAPYRLFDLRTTSGLVDEDGRELRGLRAEGPAVVRVGGYVVFALPLGDPTDWPEAATDAWACLPQRHYCDELERIPEGSRVRTPMLRDRALLRSGSSVVSRTHGPWDSSVEIPAFDGAGDDHAGTLDVKGPAGSGRLEIGRRALADGILLGRYARCDGAGLGGDASISRVHALLVQLDDRLLLVDTASRNGSKLAGETPVRVIEVRGESELQLGCKTRVRWRWSSS